jgi:hypothetical protein
MTRITTTDVMHVPNTPAMNGPRNRNALTVSGMLQQQRNACLAAGNCQAHGTHKQHHANQNGICSILQASLVMHSVHTQPVCHNKQEHLHSISEQGAAAKAAAAAAPIPPQCTLC